MMPAAVYGSTIPKAARVDSYPVEERYGMVWVLLGDDPEAAAPIPDVPEFDAEGWRWIEYEEVWDANYHWAKFSNLDYVHLPVVHGQTWNGSIRPPAHKVEYLDETSIGTGICVKTKRPKGLWSRLRPAETEVQSRMKFYLSGFTIKVDVEIGGARTGMRFVVLDMSTPIDEHTTAMRFLFGRNFMPHKWVDKGTLKRNLKNVREDQKIAEAQLPKVPKLPDSRTLMTDPEDEMVREYWSIMTKLREKGWQIDQSALQQAEKSGGYHVIPSPSRRTDPDAWVYKPVPRINPDAVAQAAE
jgi:phenylpropionate dioxygenase-like ring-hydroxylating dioxygenase large terminal subunit